MIMTDCFAYDEQIIDFFDGEFTSNVKNCKVLTELLCKKKRCPFYKKKGTENEVIFHAQGTDNTD